MPKMKRMPTVMRQGHQFSQVPGINIERSVFDVSHGHKTTFDAGWLVPALVFEVLPGDTISCSLTAFARLTTPLKPIMDNLYFDSQFFFVPYRLVWTHWVNFMGEQANPGDSISFTVPVISQAFTPNVGDIADYMGLRVKGAFNRPPSGGTLQYTGNFVKISALPFRAYNLIYNQWYRDQNLINSVPVPVNDGPDAYVGNYALQKRGKRHDYFTSALPQLQKGLAQVVPMTGLASVIPQSSAVITGTQQASQWLIAAGGGAPAANSLAMGAGGTMSTSATALAGVTALYPSNLAADLSTVAAPFTINGLRQAFQIQKFLERDMRAGTRYNELIESHFRVRNPDARLQRSEYLGGGSSPISFSPIAQATQSGLTGGTTPQGNLAGIATVAAMGHGFHRSFTEHGIIIGIVNVRADITYQQGTERFWNRQTRFDFYSPEFAHLGEQSILNSEIFTQSAAADGNTFGYQERAAEYRYKPSRISACFRSDVTAPFDVWHASEKFTALPVLNQTFIEDQTHTIISGRLVAVPAEPDFYCDMWFKMKAARAMPVFGVPGLIDHF